MAAPQALATHDPFTKEKVFRFLDGRSFTVAESDCRGCFMSRCRHLLPAEILPIAENEDLVVRQDAEWPIPGFFIVSVRQHIGSIADLPPLTAETMFRCVYAIRLGLREMFGVERAQIYHEEKIKAPHAHIWILPLWHDMMEAHAIQPKIYEGNVQSYLHLFDYESNVSRIESCNNRMRQFLLTSPMLQGLELA